jgi:hypothetical protein
MCSWPAGVFNCLTERVEGGVRTDKRCTARGAGLLPLWGRFLLPPDMTGLNMSTLSIQSTMSTPGMRRLSGTFLSGPRLQHKLATPSPNGLRAFWP